MNVKAGTGKANFLSIQYLRGIAALMVVLHHARNTQAWLFNPLEGYSPLASGVDIFFVISGFIMYEAARNEKPFDFLKRRAIRVIPLYWMSTMALLIINVKLDVFSITTDEFLHVLKSLAFIPHYNLANPEKIFPYLVPGWTLNYEMLFYFIFFIALLYGRPALITSIIIVSLVVAGRFVEFENPVLFSYTRLYMLEFPAGIFIALIYSKGRISSHMRWLLPIGFIGLLSLPEIKELIPLAWGKLMFSVFIVTGAVSLGTKTPEYKLAKLLGDASYSIYLTHIVISMWLAYKLMVMIPVEGWVQFFTWTFLSLSISSAIGIVVYLYLEKPVLEWLRARLVLARE